jgi:PAS domain S-box-containing protein
MDEASRNLTHTPTDAEILTAQAATPLILVIEDDADMRLLLKHILAETYRVEMAPDGQSGLAQGAALHPDLIITDLMLPGLSGSETVRELRSHESLASVPILVLTAVHDAATRAELLRVGAQDYLTKPFEHEELLARVAHHVSLSRAHAALLAEAPQEAVRDITPGTASSHTALSLANLAEQVAARKRALETSIETLRRSRTLYQSLARDFAHAAGVFFDADLRFTGERGTGFSSLGQSAQSALGQTPCEVFSSPIASLLEVHFRAALNGVPSTFEISDLPEKGRSLLLRAMPVRDEQGAIRGGLCVAQDLHDEALEEDEWQVFQANILAQVEDAVNVIDSQHRVLYWNNAAARLYGVEAEEALGRPLAEIYDYEWLTEGGRGVVLEALQREGWWQGECLHRLKRDGRELLVDVSLSLLREPSGGTAGFLAVIRDITARKRAEETRAQLERERDELLERLQRENDETRRLQERLRLQFERMPIGCIVWDTQLRPLSWNPAAAAIFGYELEEVRGVSAFESIIPPEAQPQVETIWQRLLSGDTRAHSINENITRDGRRIYCQWSNTPLKQPDGTINGVLSMVQDITDRVRAEEALRRSEERFRLTFEQAAIGVANISTEGRFLMVNQKLCDIVGYSREELLGGMSFQDITHPEDLEANIEQFQKALDDGLPHFSIEKRYVHKSGRPVWVSLTASLVHDPGGPPYLINVIEDITQRKQAEQAQRLLSDMSATLPLSLDYDTTLHALADLCVPALAEACIIDLVGQGVSAEWRESDSSEPLSVCRVVARHADAECDKIVQRLVDYPPRFSTDSFPARVLSQGQSLLLQHVDEEMLGMAAQDKEHLELLRALGPRSAVLAPLIARGNIIGIVTLFTTTPGTVFDENDLSLIEEVMRRAALSLENAHLYCEAQDARRAAEAADKAKDEFLAVVSHELRTPLTPILGWISMLRDGSMAGALDENTRLHAMETIQRSAELQAQLIDDLLDVSRIISGNVRLHMQPLRLRSVIEAAIDGTRPAAKQKNIAVWTAFDPALGMVEGDARRLQQVAANLLSNAIKFTPPGGRVEVQLTGRDGWARFIVRDSGVGIEPDFLPRVFDRFTQADSSTSRHHGGLGLGLSIVRHLVELHNGTVEVQSEGRDQGTTLIVSLPLLETVEATASPRVVSIPEMPIAMDGKNIANGRLYLNDEALVGVRLLVVDDEPSTRDMLAQVLRHAGAEVYTADGANAAREVLARWRPDALVCDIGMPGEDGYSFIRFLRALHADDGGTMPAIALTAYARSEDRDRALAAGYQRHLSKPVAPAELIAAVRDIAPQRGDDAN